MKKYKLGYTQGTFDMFHIGHLNLINKAKEQCEVLLVGVNSDKLVQEYKSKNPVIPENERLSIVDAIKSVDKSFIVDTLDKMHTQNLYKYDVVFIGDDWKNSERWLETEHDLNSIGVDVVFIPYTPGVSSTMLRKKEKDKIHEKN